VMVKRAEQAMFAENLCLRQQLSVLRRSVIPVVSIF
jgi:hypothetical protein